MLEALLDNVVGLAINFFLVLLIYNVMLGQDISMKENAIGSIAFFIIAWIRKYTIRRWSSRLIGRIYAERKAQEDAELQEQAGKS